MRITNQGELRFCRFSNELQQQPRANIVDVDPIDFFQSTMASVREQMIAGDEVAACVECQNMERHGKLSGRQRQLIKTGVRLTRFEKTMRTSPFWEAWQETNHMGGETLLTPQDWQIDLGNFCNSGCVFCLPESSSRLATEFVKIGLRDALPPRTWCDSEALLDRFIMALRRCSNLRYLHFLGGETLITPAFKEILDSLIDNGTHQKTTIGLTTNLTVWPERVIDSLCKFSEVHLNMSIEALHRINDYARWPSEIDDVRARLDRWVELGKARGWLMTLRITPTVLTMHHVWSVYEYAMQHGLNVESCNFIYNPQFMRPTVLPLSRRREIAAQLRQQIEAAGGTNHTQILNIRHPALAAAAALQDAASYVDYLESADDESYLMEDLMQYLKKLDVSRGISVLDYLPEYEKLFRSSGYN
jgi:MoaA/NifB/PqqE/SkfB family radical SAM enzyme